MFQFFLNPWMLLGIAGIAFPIVAHLLSRRRFDVVEWGAMQFLNPSRKTRRRLKLEELLLLLLRIGLICLIVFAVTRPVIPGGWLSGYRSGGSRTVVVIVDGSNSMSRTDGINSIHQNAVRRAGEFLQTLGADDSVALIDARDQPRSVIESPLRDLSAAEAELRRLPPPGGACGMLAAIEKAVGILGRSSSSAREIVIFSDRQAEGWKTNREPEWMRIDDMLRFPSVRPQVWVVDVAPHLKPVTRNVSVGQIEMSREMSVPDFPVRLRVAVRNQSDREAQIPVRLLLNGQALAGELQTPSIAAGGEMMLEFDHAIRHEGSHVLTVEADVRDDEIAVDNSSHAAIQVSASLSVLLINGTPATVAADRDTFFTELAFAPPEGKPPWVNARVIESADLKPEDFHSAAVAVFCNVEHISAECAVALADFAERGNGVIIGCGPNTSSDSFQKCFQDSGLLPQVEIVRVREAPPQADSQVLVAPLSIQSGWLERFRSDPARSFLKARFTAWCLTKINAPATAQPSVADTGESGHEEIGTAAVTLAQLNTGDPLILQARHGSGLILVMTSTLDRTWTDLPTRADFVPFLHEAVFHVASARSQRNVRFAEPLVARFARTPGTVTAEAEPLSEKRIAGKSEGLSEVPQVRFTRPDKTESTALATTEMQGITAVLPSTFAPGIYTAEYTESGDGADKQREAFVVNYDHSEDDLRELTPDDKALLATNDRVRFAMSLDDLTKRMYGDESMTELWAVLITLFLLFLAAELLLTRRAIRKGYGGESIA